MKFNRTNVFLGVCMAVSAIIMNYMIPNSFVAFILGFLWGIIVFMPQNTTFKRYGRTWYSTRMEAENNRHPPDTIVYDKSFDAYYIKKV